MFIFSELITCILCLGDNMIYFGTRLKELRKSKQITQKELAESIDLVKSSISAYEKDLKYPSIDVLIKLSNYFNVSCDYLLGLSDNLEINKFDLTEEQREILIKLITQFHHFNSKRQTEYTYFS